MKEIIFFTVLIFTSIPAISNDVCNCKGYDGPGGACYDGPGGPAYDGPGGACYDGPGGPAYDGPGGPCYDGPGGSGESCPAVCKQVLWIQGKSTFYLSPDTIHMTLPSL